MIVPSTELAGVHLLMSAAGVRHVLGAPRSTAQLADGSRRLDFARGTKVYISPTGDGAVFRITTTDRRQKTAAGVGVGSSRASVARKVSGARCAARACVVGQELAGQRVTRFTLTNGRVTRVTLGFVID